MSANCHVKSPSGTLLVTHNLPLKIFRHNRQSNAHQLDEIDPSFPPCAWLYSLAKGARLCIEINGNSHEIEAVFENDIKRLAKLEGLGTIYSL